MPVINELYVAILPLIHLGTLAPSPVAFGMTEQVLTLFPLKDLAARFFPEDVAGYLATLQNRLDYLTGGHVKGYEIHQDRTADGLVILRVVQHVEY